MARRLVHVAVGLTTAALVTAGVVVGARLASVAAAGTTDAPAQAVEQTNPVQTNPVQAKARPQLLTPSAAEAERSLATLRQHDGHPLFSMSYFGPAPRVDTGEAPAATAAPTTTPPTTTPPTATPPTTTPPTATGGQGMRKPFACTVFVAAGGRPLFGRNFDWDPNPAMVVLANPTDAYRSVSVVDISYLGITAAAAVADPAKRAGLLRAVTLPFDGMNEHGLTIGMAAVDDLRTELRPGRPAIGGVSVMRQVLDHARTVDEAVAILGSYNIDFDGGPALHYIVAEASGKSAVVEFVDGRLTVVPGRDGWQVMENFLLTTVADTSGFARYTTAAGRLAGAGGSLTAAASMDLLATVAQGHTQWSVVYDPVALTVRLSTGKRYDVVHEFALP